MCRGPHLEPSFQSCEDTTLNVASCLHPGISTAGVGDICLIYLIQYQVYLNTRQVHRSIIHSAVIKAHRWLMLILSKTLLPLLNKNLEFAMLSGVYNAKTITHANAPYPSPGCTQWEYLASLISLNPKSLCGCKQAHLGGQRPSLSMYTTFSRPPPRSQEGSWYERNPSNDPGNLPRLPPVQGAC